MPQGRPPKRKRSPFGERLSKSREKAGYTQGELAGKLGISQRTYSDWEMGSVALSPERLRELAALLGTTAGELVDGREPKGKRLPANSRLGQSVEALGKLPRRRQSRILDVLDAMLAQEESKAG